MWEFLLKNKATGEEEIIWGYNIRDAFRRNPALKPDSWIVVRQDFEGSVEEEIVCAFTIQHKATKETSVINGVTLEEAFEVSGLDPDNWEAFGG